MLEGTGKCTITGRSPLAGERDRCGHGPHIPLLVISPYAEDNCVNHSVTDQPSILAFIQQNWNLGTIAGSLAQEA